VREIRNEPPSCGSKSCTWLVIPFGTIHFATARARILSRLRGQHTNGSAETFEAARAEFELAWERLKPTRTEAHYELYRRSRDFHAWKNRMHDERLKMPTQNTNGVARCYCGAEITIASVEAHIQDAHRGETARPRARRFGR
jgi:hypothetical protein